MLQPRDDDEAAAAAPAALSGKAFHMLQHYVPILRWLPSYDVRYLARSARAPACAWRRGASPHVRFLSRAAAAPPAPVAQALAG